LVSRAYDHKTVRVRVGDRQAEAGTYVAVEVDDTLLSSVVCSGR
jgi:hypothetical protein